MDKPTLEGEARILGSQMPIPNEWAPPLHVQGVIHGGQGQGRRTVPEGQAIRGHSNPPNPSR